MKFCSTSTCRYLTLFFLFATFLALPPDFFATGVLDTTFGNSGVVVTDLSSDASVKSLHQQADGKIVVVAKNNGSIVLLRYNTAGGLDTTFGTSGIIITAYGSSDAKVTVTLQSNGLFAVGNNSSVIRYTSAGGISEIVNFPMGDFAGFGLDGKIATATLAPANGVCVFTGPQQYKINYSLYDSAGALLSSTHFCSGGVGTTGIDGLWGITPSSANTFYVGYKHRALNASNGRVREMLSNTTVQDLSVDIGLIGYNLVDLASTRSHGFVSLGYYLFSRQLPSYQSYMPVPVPPQAPTYKKIHGNDITAALKGNFSVLVLNEAFAFQGTEYIGRYFGAAPEQSNVYVQNDNKILIGGQVRSGDGNWNIGLIRYSSVRGGSVEPSDFDDDARSDLSIWRPADSRWHVQGSAGYTVTQFGSAGDRIVPADYDGDGKTNLALFRPTEGKWYVMSSFGSVSTYNWGMPGDFPIPSDRDGDGKADLVIYRESDNKWYTRSIATEEISIVQFGQAGDRPVIGDFDADGKWDTAVFRPSNNNWYTLNVGTGYSVRTWGETSDVPVPSDYDGDGRTDIATFRPSTGQWWRIKSTDGYDVVNWGQAGDVPAPADYDGDGKSDAAVFRPSNGTWYILGSTSGFTIRQFGLSGDVPTQSAFIY